jgi:transcription initiation factor TFIIIB Brf1 subunit/transcription initiation factor TFIIB
MLMKLHNRQTGSDRNVQAASREINEICERLKLPDTVKNSALEVYRDVSRCAEGLAC